MSKQSTLGVFGFTKTVKGEAIRIPKFVNSEKQKKKVCPLCNQLLMNQQGLSVHMKCKHATDATSNNKISLAPTSQISSTGNKYSTEIVDPTVIPSTSRENPEKIERRRGQHKRYIHTDVFKTQVIMELES